MPEKVEILVELKNDQDVKKKLKDIQSICDKLSKGVTVPIKADISNINKAVQDVKKTLSDISRPHTVGLSNTEIANTAHALSGVQQTLNDIERPRTITINTSHIGSAMNMPTALNIGEALGLPSVIERGVRDWLVAQQQSVKMLPSLFYQFANPATFPQYGTLVGSPYSNVFTLPTQPNYSAVTAMSRYGVGGLMLPAIRQTGALMPIMSFYNGYTPNFVMGNGGPTGFIFQGTPNYGSNLGNYGVGGFQAPAVREMGALMTFTNDFEQRMREAIGASEADWREFTDFMHDPAFNNIPKKYWEDFTNGAAEARQETVSLQQVLTGLGSGFQTIGSALTGIGNLFHMDLFGTVERTLTAYGTILATQGFRNAISRYDIMTTYPEYMEIMGVSAEKAEKSLDKVNAAIQGIPVGLDTAAQEIRMFTMYLQGTDDSMDDVADKATNLTIGLERALVAGGASEAMKTTAKYEIQRLLATGSLTTKRQWQALLNGLGVSGQYLKDVMGYGGMSTQDFISDLTSGDISTDAFIQGIADLADYKGLNEAIDIYKETIEAGMYDIRFALTRGFANTFQVVNDMLKSETGQGIRGYMEDIRNGINELFFDIQDWIREHPEVITMIFDKLNEIMARAKEIGVGQIMSDIATQGGKMVDFFIKIYDALPPGFWRNLIVFSTTWAGPLGRLFTGIGSVLTILGRFAGLLDKIPLIGGLLAALFKPAGGTVISGVGGFKTIFGSLGAVLGMEGVIAAAGGVIYEFAKIGESIAGMDLDGYTENMKKLLPFIGAVSGVMAVLVGGVGGATAASGGAVAIFAAIGEAVTLGLLAEIDYAVQIIGSLANVAQTIADLDLPSDFSTKVGDFGKGVAAIYKMLPDLSPEEVTDSGNLKEFFTNMGDAIGAMDGAAETLSNIEGKMNWLNRSEGKFDDIKTKVSNFAEGIGDIYQAFVDGFGPAGPAKRASDKYADTLENMNKAMTELSSLATAMSEMEYQLDTLQLGIAGKTEEVEHEVVTKTGRSSRSSSTVSYTTEEWAPDNFQKYVKRIREFVQGMDKIFDILGESSWKAGWESTETTYQKNTLEAMSKAIEYISDMATNISEFYDSFDGGRTARSMKRIEKFVSDVFGLFGTEGFQNITSMGNAAQMAENFQNVGLAFGGENGNGGIVAMAKALRNMIAPLVAIENEDVVSNLSRVINDVRGIFIGSWAVDEGDGRDILSKADNAKQAVDKIEEIVNTLSSINGTVSGLFGEENNVGTKISQLLNSMYGSLSTENAEAFAGQIDNMALLMTHIQRMFDALSQTDLSGLNEQMQNVIDKLWNQLNPGLETLDTNLENAHSSAALLSGSLQHVGVMAAMASGYIPTLQSNLSNLVGTMGQAQQAASNLASALGSIPTNISTNVSVNRVNSLFPNGGRGGGNMRVPFATGGPVGTDTIPAWLSPGEFVMRAKAVRTFGEVFMRNVNQLNIPGAVNALAKQYAFNNPTSNSYVNNYDNHASVNQTIITNNADYSYKRASRFVRALH